jgi:hypothetical protein
MTTVIFVHGIGGRIYNYLETFETIEKEIKNLREDIIVHPCLWGDDLGAKYRIVSGGSVSTPEYDQTREEEDLNNSLLWEKLYKDPFYEIRFLSLKKAGITKPPRVGELSPFQQIDSSLKNLVESTNEDLRRLKLISGIADDIFQQAHKAITTSDFYKEQLKLNASEPLDEYYETLSRFFVAEAIYLLEQQARSASIRWNPKLRDDIMDCICKELTRGVQRRALVTDWLKKQALWGLQSMFLDTNRGSLTDFVSPYAGDILVYQANGKRIRQFIKEEIEKEEIIPPVVLLAHSLGGIACVDLLVEQNLPKVELLVTVGSQAPFLYEIGALQSLLPDDKDELPPLPEHFFSEDKWLNIYDPKDILSYYASGAFPGRVTDKKVNNMQHFPQAHNAYWSNSDMWDEIVRRLP